MPSPIKITSAGTYVISLKTTIKKIISEFHEKGLPELIERDIELPQYKQISKGVVITGPRRAGKTFLLFQIMKKKKPNITSFLYLNFEDERLRGLDGKDLGLTLDAYYELYPKNKPLLFLDEIQNVGGWSNFIRRVIDQGFEVYLTGSNSKLLSKDIAEALRGRVKEIRLYPFSFKEFLKAKQITLGKNWEYSKEQFIVKNAFTEYINLSGFPEIVLEKDISLIDSYYNDLFYRDLISRYSLKNEVLLDKFLKYLASNYGANFTINKFRNFMKSIGLPCSTSTLYEYTKMVEDVFYAFLVRKFEKSFKKKEGSPRKSYIIDQGFWNFFGQDIDKGRALENIVFINLLRKGCDVFFHKNSNECDFILPKEKLAIQVCSYLNPENQKREIDGLIDGMKRIAADKGLIITLDQEDTLDGGIKIIPAWKWLLE